MTFDSTLGGSEANSYASVASADAYALQRWWGATWTPLPEASKEIALMSATQAMETISWNGIRCHPSKDDADKPQALSWPRSEVECDGIKATCAAIPQAILNATYELAYQLSQNPGALQPDSGGGGAVPGTFRSEETIGDLTVKYEAFPRGVESETCTSCSDPEVISKYPWLKGWLKCWASWGSITGSGTIYRVRS